jgi:LPXTG-motif cell wall-anchored protein
MIQKTTFMGLGLLVVGLILGQAGMASAMAPQIVSLEWEDPAMAGWAYGTATRTLNITVDDATKYAPLDTSMVAWYTVAGQAGTPATSVTKVGNTYEVEFDLTGTTTKVGGVGITLIDLVTGQPIVITNGVTDMTMLLAHNLNIKGNAPAECASTTKTDETTDLTTVTDFRTVNLTVACPAIGKIRFTTPMDFTTTAGMDALRNIFTSLEAEKVGEIGLSDNTAALLKNAGAEVTLYKLPYNTLPDIKYNGGDATNKASGITYDTVTKTLTLSAAGFSSYSAVPKVTITEPTSSLTVENSKYTVQGTVNDSSATVTVKVGSIDQGTVTVASDGSFSKEVALSSGANTVTISSSNGIGSGFDVVRTITYTPAQTLAATGNSTWWILGVSGTLIIGMGLFVLGKKRQIA